MEVGSLRQRFSRLTDEELLRVLGADRKDYREVALEVASAELARRGISPPAVARAPAAAAPQKVRVTLSRPAPAGAAWTGLRIAVYTLLLAAAFVTAIKSSFWEWPPGAAGWLTRAGFALLICGAMALLERRLMAGVRAFKEALDGDES